MAQLRRTEVTLHSGVGWGPDGTATWYRVYTSQIGRTGPLWQNYIGCGPYGTAIRWGLYCTPTENTDLIAHICRTGTAWHSHRTGTVWHSYRGHGPYGTPKGWGLYRTVREDAELTVHLCRMGTVRHSHRGRGPYGTASPDRDCLAQLPGSDRGVTVGRERVLSLAAPTGAGPHGGQEGPTQPGQAVLLVPASCCLPSSLFLHRRVAPRGPPAPCPPSSMGVPQHVAP